MTDTLFTLRIRSLMAAALMFLTAPALFCQGEADILLEELVRDKGNVGAAAGYAVGGEWKWKGASGFACRESATAFTDTTLTRIASISKNMTAVAIMQLYESGKIDLDAPIQTYYPGFPEKPEGTITTRHLLAHTSGIPQYLDESEIENSVEYPTLEDAVEVFRDRPLKFSPGSDYFYTSYGYVVLGRIIEEVSGQSFGEYMKEHIWDKAGMTHTGIEEFGNTYAGKSCLYNKKRKKARLGESNNLSNRVPGGGFYSTLLDVLRFGQAVIDGRLISQETLELMLESQPVDYNGNKYGMGWFFYGPAGSENLVIGHSGGQTGCTSQLFLIPKSETVVAVLSNTSRTYQDVATLASNLVRISEAEKED